MKKLFVLFAAIALVAAFTLPAAAATWDFYGSSRMTTFYESPDVGPADIDDLTWDLQGNARIGANVKNGAVAGRFEYSSGPSLRILYGTWDFGGGSLLVGQGYTPVDTFDSNQVWGGDNDLLSYGALYTGRAPMIQLSMGGFDVALVRNDGLAELVTDGGTESLLPKLEASYTMNAGPARLKFVGAAASYTADPNGIDEGVSAYAVGTSIKAGFGPATVAVNGFYGQNVGQLNWVQHGDPNAQLNAAGTGVEDTDSYGGIFLVNFKATPMLSFEVGVGYSVNENDTFVEDDDGMSYYGNAVVNIAPGFFIVPEIGVVDYGDGPSGADEGDMFYAGAKWQINF